jgi:perosamine synthetase
MSMAFGKIPRFSPSFSPKEALISAKYLLFEGDHRQKVEKFEQRFANYIGVKNAVMVPSARYGFYLLLKAYGVSEGDEVIVPGLTYFAIPAMVPLLQAKPVFADVGLNSHVLDPHKFQEAITERTKIVVPTHLFGTPCNMKEINRIAKQHDIKIIEDCAQSTGGKYAGKRVGSWGDAAYYTFGLTKNITTLSGAMITTNNDDVAHFIRSTIDSGGFTPRKKSAKEAFTGLAMYIATHPKIYWATVHPAVVFGNKFGKDPIHDRFGEEERSYSSIPTYYHSEGKARSAQAAVGLRQLDRIEELNGARVKNGQAFDLALKNVTGLQVPEYPENAEPIYMSFVVHHKDRKSLAKALRKRGVDTTTGYMNDLSDHPLFQDYQRDCPNSKEANANLLHIPVHPNLTECDTKHIIQSVIESCLEIAD